MRLRFWIYSAMLSTAVLPMARAVSYEPSSLAPPKPLREFRGVWVATVANIDWPSKPDLTTSAQKRELLDILDQAARLKLNAVVFQVRPACDALYASPYEPWSEYLTGTMGRAPAPFYDPLAFAVAEAHKRGLELHAWLNPFRALHFSNWSRIAANHISRTRPDLVRKYGQYLWLDPGEKDVQDYSLKVVVDLVRRYDIDGIQFDDYFYPVEKDANGHDLDFPDGASWERYGRGTGLSRDDWRRENVNRFVQRVYQSVKAAKPYVKFGISPFGIWRPGQPAAIKGTDAYASFYADSRKWLVNGWVDYLAPQLYWPIEPKEQSFASLLSWWAGQNPRNRLLLAGISIANAGRWRAEEIPEQIRLVRGEAGADGYVLYNAGTLLRSATWSAMVERDINRKAALVPAMSWLEDSRPAKPSLWVGNEESTGLRARWLAAQDGPARWWLLQFRNGGIWTTELLPSYQTSQSFNGDPPEVISISTVDRVGNLSAPAVLTQGSVSKAPPVESRPIETRKPVRKAPTPRQAQ